MRISYTELYNELKRILLKKGFTTERAELSARLFAETSRDGVYSHGLNRFPSYIHNIEKNRIDIHATPTKVEAMGALERWDGLSGPGNLNAYMSMERAIQLSKEHGMGCVALKNTNHWLRAGSYGWQAADANCVGICWTNTMPNMPPWGSKEHKVGNNPLMLAVPRQEGHIVLDMAMSQFSYGQLSSYSKRGETLPVAGGYDNDGNLTNQPKQVVESGRLLPIGYWKGSGLALMLDLIAMMLSGGRSTLDIGKDDGDYGVSQVFIAFNMDALSDRDLFKDRLNLVIQDLHEALPADEQGNTLYPGEDTLRRRQYNLTHGIPVDPEIWEKVIRMQIE